MTSTQTLLYRFYDGDDQLLYVGISLNAGARFVAHSSQKDWWDQVHVIGLEYFDTRDEAFAAEKQSIAQEAPLYNVRKGTTPKATRAPASGTAKALHAVRLEPETVQAIDRIAAAEGRTRADVIRRLITEGLQTRWEKLGHE